MDVDVNKKLSQEFIAINCAVGVCWKLGQQITITDIDWRSNEQFTVVDLSWRSDHQFIAINGVVDINWRLGQ